MTSRIFRSIVTVAAAILCSSLILIMGVLYGYANDLQTAQLKDELSIAASGTEQGGLNFLKTVEAKRFRLTWIQSDGTVLYDTHADSEEMENHLQREEIQQALGYGSGSAVRQSDTLLEKRMYEAVRLSDGSVLRISASQQTLVVLLAGMLHPVCIVAALAIILSAILAHRVSCKIVEPLNHLDLEHPLENDTYEELSPLLVRIHQQHKKIENQLQTLQRKNDEFDQITANMHEGLVLLDGSGAVLSLNPAAQKLFGADKASVGRPFCAVDRKSDMTAAVETALEQGHSELKAERQGRTYQFLLNRISSGEDVIGLMILALDVTDVQNAEQSRREFTANVSHELKTPLQSIIGSAELLENGLVKPEDTQRFISNIRKEASRLVLLIEDVIRLSHLDEGVEMPREDVDLLDIAEEVSDSLRLAAEEKKVSIRVSGDHCTFPGVRGLVFEIAQNLCANAVKYNVEGGKVDVTVAKKDGRVVLTVADTGIGIPRSQQSRVFERFYRVDKSHSRASGGTGLGLSIVKHAAQYHNADIQLQSVPGKGTTVTVAFPM
ncbi:MAG: ATP-binding protein [Eubacteriales bacterium]|nr:ATP-binding protein [Eubacteriales bacterium]